MTENHLRCDDHWRDEHLTRFEAAFHRNLRRRAPGFPGHEFGEAMGEVWLTLHPRFSGRRIEGSNPEGYVARAVRNEIHQYLRKEHRAQQWGGMVRAPRSPSRRASGERDQPRRCGSLPGSALEDVVRRLRGQDVREPLKCLIYREECEAVCGALGRLCADDNRLISMTFGFGCPEATLGEMAEAFRITIPAIRKRQKRVLAKLKSLLATLRA